MRHFDGDLQAMREDWCMDCVYYFDAQAENWLDKMERGSRWLAWVCCAIVLYFIGRAMWG